MRVIAGSARRVRLEVAEDSSTRPFLELARGALFNALGDRVVGATALDLYAGSGALGLEALSRGAASCLFVERDAAAFRALGANIAKCGFAAVAKAVRADVAVFLRGAAGPFDLIFADPPFPDAAAWAGGEGGREVMRLAGGLVAPGGVLVFRLEGEGDAPPEWPGLVSLAARRYGRSLVCRYGRADAQ